jgi:hypothetical protein
LQTKLEFIVWVRRPSQWRINDTAKLAFAGEFFFEEKSKTNFFCTSSWWGARIKFIRKMTFMNFVLPKYDEYLSSIIFYRLFFKKNQVLRSFEEKLRQNRLIFYNVMNFIKT